MFSIFMLVNELGHLNSIQILVSDCRRLRVDTKLEVDTTSITLQKQSLLSIVQYKI